MLDGEWPEPVATDPGRLSKIRLGQIYMDEETLVIKPDGMARLRHDLRDLLRLLLATDPR